MTDLSRLVEATAAGSLPYLDPAFPNHLQVLHAARPRDQGLRAHSSTMAG